MFVCVCAGLQLDSEELVKLDALECMKQMEIIAAMPVNLDVKRKLRERLYAQDPDFDQSSCRALCYSCKLVSHMPISTVTYSYN